MRGRWRPWPGTLSKYPDLAGISYEYADGFLGALTAYQNANKAPNVVATIQTDETGLFCEWKKLNNPNFKLYHGYGRNFQSRVALTVAMMKLKGATIPAKMNMPSCSGRPRTPTASRPSRPRLRHRTSYRRS